MSPKIEQRTLFGTSTPSKTVTPPLKTTAYKNPVNTTLLGGLDDASLKADSVYMLRVLSNQYTRAFPAKEAKKKFINTITAEIKLKQGRAEPTLLLRDCLLQRNVTVSS